MSGPKRHDSGKLAARVGVPTHLLHEAHCKLLEHCPEQTPTQTDAIHRVLLKLLNEGYDAGAVHGEAVALYRQRLLSRDVGRAWAEAMRKLLGLAPEQFTAPPLSLVAAELRVRGAIANDAHVRAVCETSGLPLADDPPTPEAA